MSPPPSADQTIVLKLHVGCQHCGYDLYMLRGDPIRCPECGGMNPYQVVLQNWNRVREPRFGCAIGAILLGALLWLGPAWLGGTREAWDSGWGWLWFVGTVFVCGALGYAAPSFYAVSSVLVVLSQYIALYARTSGPRFACVTEAAFLGVVLLSLLTAHAGAAFRRLDRYGWRPER